MRWITRTAVSSQDLQRLLNDATGRGYIIHSIHYCGQIFEKYVIVLQEK